MADVPTHPGRTQQQGLTPQTDNPYYVPNQALTTADAIQGSEQAQAQAAQVRAQANKTLAERDILVAGLGNLQAGPNITPQQVQAEQLADGLVRGQLDQNTIQGMLANGQVDPGVAEAAMGMAQQFIQQDQQRLNQPGGLGQF